MRNPKCRDCDNADKCHGYCDERRWLPVRCTETRRCAVNRTGRDRCGVVGCVYRKPERRAELFGGEA